MRCRRDKAPVIVDVGGGYGGGTLRLVRGINWRPCVDRLCSYASTRCAQIRHNWNSTCLALSPCATGAVPNEWPRRLNKHASSEVCSQAESMWRSKSAMQVDA